MNSLILLHPLYDACFPRTKIKLEARNLEILLDHGEPKALQSLLRKKQKLYGIYIYTYADIFDQEKIATEFNRFFANVGSTLAKQIPESENSFESYIVKTFATMQHKSFSIVELRDAFFSLKLNKSPGNDKISFIVKICFSKLREPLRHLSNLFIETWVFQDKLKIARVSPVYKVGDSSDQTNNRTTSVLSCFSRIFVRIVYNRLFSYMPQEKILHSKQFGFQCGHF